MISDVLWVLYYRCKCFKVTVDAAFYYLISFNILLSLDNLCRSILWIILLVFLTPIEFLIAISVSLLDTLNISPETVTKIKHTMFVNGKTKEYSSQEFEEYKKFLFEEEKK